MNPYRYIDPCAFDVSPKRCACLSVKQCMKCRFRKTKEELIAGRAKAAERLTKLPHSDALIAKYYGRPHDDTELEEGA